ncbi:MAG: DNA polymerase III subunit chi [Gammaproteobacteria bacterium]
MTRIDFYILSAVANNCQLFVCRLADKIYTQGHRLYIHAQSQQEAAQIDELLWTFSTANFLPHGLCESGADSGLPIQIGCNSEPARIDGHDGDVLINLTPVVPLFFSRFARVAEIVGQDEDSKLSARERFRFYRDRGYALESHTI